LRGWLLATGVVVLVIGILIAAFAFSSPAGLGAGIVLLIAGIILAGIGAATGAAKVQQSVVQPTVRSPAGQTMGGGEAGGMDSMVRTLASLDEGPRREMIRTRLSSFAAMNDSERANSMRMMIGAIQKLDQASIRKLTYTRMESLAEDFDPQTRKKLMGTHMTVVMGLPKEQMMGEITSMVSVMGQCHEACRMKDMGTMKELMMEMPQEKRGMMMQMLPPDVQKMLMG